LAILLRRNQGTHSVLSVNTLSIFQVLGDTLG